MFYCKEHFRDVGANFHDTINAVAVVEKFLAVQAPRGSSKSTIITFAHVVWGICLKKYHFIIIVQNTYAKAAATLEGIKTEIKTNEKLRRDFPLDVKKDAEGDTVFRYPGPGWECRVLCKGADQIGGVRGERHGAWRPDLIIIDDLEDDELVRNAERRRKLQEDFDGALIPAMDVKKCKLIAVGTILHDDSLMARLVSPDYYPEFKKLFYKARYDNADGSRRCLWT
jgi:hypothetical protein